MPVLFDYLLVFHDILLLMAPTIVAECTMMQYEAIKVLLHNQLITEKGRPLSIRHDSIDKTSLNASFL